MKDERFYAFITALRNFAEEWGIETLGHRDDFDDTVLVKFDFYPKRYTQHDMVETATKADCVALNTNNDRQVVAQS